MSGVLDCSSDAPFRDSPSRNLLRREHRSCRLAAICLFAVLCGNLTGQDATSIDESRPVFGWHGHTLVGSWTEVIANVDIDEPGEYQLRVTAPDPDGHRVTFETIARLPKGRHPLRGYFRVGQLEPDLVEVTVVALTTGKPVWSWRSTRRAAAQGTAPLPPSYRLVATVGNPPGFDWGDVRPADDQAASTSLSRNLRPIAMQADALPVDARAYDSISMLVIAGHTVVSAEQAGALRDWIASGGKLTISLPTDPAAARVILQPFADWLPVTLTAEPITISELGKLESFAGKNVRISLSGRLRVPSLRITHGEVLAGNRDEAVLVRTPYGLGSVTVLALDLTQPPLSKWTELSALTQRLAQANSEAAAQSSTPTRTLQLSSTGITDLATQLHAAQEVFPEVNRASPWLAMGLLVAILLVVGPLDYLVVHRVLKWPRGTWLTLPIWVVLAAGGSANLAAKWNGSSFRINQLNIVNYDVSSATCHQRLWTNVYSPTTERRSISVRSTIASASNAASNAADSTAKPAGANTSGANTSESTQSSWSGIAETAYGGMLRRAGVNVGSADYVAGPAIDGLPLLQWSSKPLLTEVHSSAEGMVKGDLESNGVGQLSGTISHRFSGPIEDWFLAYGNRVYRHKKTRDDPKSLPLRAGQILRIDQPTVFPRELRAFLIGKVTTSRTPQGEAAASVSSQFTSYDPMSRDPAEVVRILTFHHEAGGTKYTGLTNRLLEDEDLSHLLSLGRAILFGRLEAPVAAVRLDNQSLAANRETTFIRIILPVKKIGSDITRDLERFDK